MLILNSGLSACSKDSDLPMQSFFRNLPEGIGKQPFKRPCIVRYHPGAGMAAPLMHVTPALLRRGQPLSASSHL